MKNNTLLAKYKNGNYIVELYYDGTKIKTTENDFFNAEFPDSMDMKITNYCDLNCPMCHEKSSTSGNHADLNQPFLKTLKAGTELAIGGGNPLSHPNIIELLKDLKERKIIANLTVNEQHFLKNIDLLQNLIDEKLIWGLGISLNKYNKATLDFAKKNKNVVFHLILGITTLETLEKLFNQNLKILLLGYKKFGRGETFHNEKIDLEISRFNEKLLSLFQFFNLISFDNLAIKQLDLKNKLDNKTWEEFYMGDDGESTMYIDLVEKQFAVSSTSKTRFPLKEDIKEMFEIVKKLR